MIGNCRERFVVNLNQSRRIFGEIAIRRNDQRHRLADVANPIAGHDPLSHVQCSRDHVHARKHVVD